MLLEYPSQPYARRTTTHASKLGSNILFSLGFSRSPRHLFLFMGTAEHAFLCHSHIVAWDWDFQYLCLSPLWSDSYSGQDCVRISLAPLIC